MDRKEFYKSITDSIITLIEEKNILPWEQPWQNKKPNINSANFSVLPYNPVTGTIYKGMNYLTTKYSATYNTDADPRFLTFKNINDCGFSLKKDSKSIPVYFIAPISGVKKNSPKGDLLEEDSKVYSFVYKKYNVFHASCIEGIPDYIPPKEFLIKDSTKKLIQDLISKAPIKVFEGGNRAFYSPKQDQIQMPKLEQFEKPNDFYAVLLHEIGHWTMNKDRVPRLDDFNTDQKIRRKEKYAAEELVAELFSVTASPFFNIQYSKLKSANYLQSWLAVLKNDVKFIYRASAYAEAATEFCLNIIGLDKVKKITPQITPVKFHVNDIQYPFYGKNKKEIEPYLEDLLAGNKTKTIKGLSKANGKPFDAQLKLQKRNNKISVQFFFAKKKRSKTFKR